MLSWLQQKWISIIAFISEISKSGEQNVRKVHFTAFLLCAIPTMVVFGTIDFYHGKYILSLLILISALALLIGLILLFRIKNGRIVYRFNMLFFFTLALYMVYLGGDGGSKSLWAFIFPLIAFFLLGLKEATLWCICTFICLACLFWNPLKFEAAYPYAFSYKIRFLLSYTIISFVTSWFEYFRAHYQEDLKMKNMALEQEHRQLHHEILERKRLEKSLKTIANTDALTGIMNRRYFWKRTNNEIQRHLRYNHPILILRPVLVLLRQIRLKTQLRVLLQGQTMHYTRQRIMGGTEWNCTRIKLFQSLIDLR